MRTLDVAFSLINGLSTRGGTLKGIVDVVVVRMMLRPRGVRSRPGRSAQCFPGVLPNHDMSSQGPPRHPVHGRAIDEHVFHPHPRQRSSSHGVSWNRSTSRSNEARDGRYLQYGLMPGHRTKLRRLHVVRQSPPFAPSFINVHQNAHSTISHSSAISAIKNNRLHKYRDPFSGIGRKNRQRFNTSAVGDVNAPLR